MGKEANDVNMAGWDEVIEAEAEQLWHEAVQLAEATCGRFHEEAIIARLRSTASKYLGSREGTESGESAITSPSAAAAAAAAATVAGGTGGPGSNRSSLASRPTSNSSAVAAIVSMRSEIQELEESLGPRHVCTLSGHELLARVLEAQGLFEEAEEEWLLVVTGRRQVGSCMTLNSSSQLTEISLNGQIMLW
jgi:hypothetical protein